MEPGQLQATASPGAPWDSTQRDRRILFGVIYWKLTLHWRVKQGSPISRCRVRCHTQWHTHEPKCCVFPLFFGLWPWPNLWQLEGVLIGWTDHSIALPPAHLWASCVGVAVVDRGFMSCCLPALGPCPGCCGSIEVLLWCIWWWVTRFSRLLKEHLTWMLWLLLQGKILLFWGDKRLQVGFCVALHQAQLGHF